VSSLDWRSHAIDEDAEHPYGVYVARCGQPVFMGTSLYDAHLLLPEGDHPPGVLKAHCGEMMITGLTQHDQPPPGLTCQRCRLITVGTDTSRHIIEQAPWPVIEETGGTAVTSDSDSPDLVTSVTWRLSTEDWHWHLPAGQCDPPGALMARCGALLRSDAVHNDDPMDTARCAKCSNAPDTSTAADTTDIPPTGKDSELPRIPAYPVQVSVQGTRTDDNTACTLLAIRETDGTWMIHTLDKVAVRLTDDEGTRLATAILHLAGHPLPAEQDSAQKTRSTWRICNGDAQSSPTSR
jgi:hypothetical protein